MKTGQRTPLPLQPLLASILLASTLLASHMYSSATLSKFPHEPQVEDDHLTRSDIDQQVLICGVLSPSQALVSSSAQPRHTTWILARHAGCAWEAWGSLTIGCPENCISSTSLACCHSCSLGLE